MHEVAIDGPEMVLESASKGQPHIYDLVTGQRKHIVLKVLIKDLLCLVHDLFAHDNEKLSSFKGSFDADAEIVGNDLDDGFLLAGIVSELV